MTPIMLLSAGLIVTAMLATPAMARENHDAKRYAAEESNKRMPPIARYYDYDGHFGIQAPAVRELPKPADGESCDVGDNPFIC
jgi:hypothetical protein